MKKYVVEVWVSGWLFRTEALSAENAAAAAQEFKQRNPLSRPNVVEAA